MTQISDVISNVRGQTDVTLQMVDRLRSANRRMTGATGAAPTPTSVKQTTATEEPPLLTSLADAVESLRQANNDLLNEVNYLETYTETGSLSTGSKLGYAKAA